MGRHVKDTAKIVQISCNLISCSQDDKTGLYNSYDFSSIFSTTLVLSFELFLRWLDAYSPKVYSV
jgi:hypothetical protein